MAGKGRQGGNSCANYFDLREAFKLGMQGKGWLAAFCVHPPPPPLYLIIRQ
jgi:hypothetical protein